MNCSCRTAALRIFVRSVVRVHTPYSTPARGTRSCRTLSQPIRHGCRDSPIPYLRTLPFLVSSRRRLSSSLAALDEGEPQGNPADDATSTTPHEGEAEGKADGTPVAPLFPKALKAKKKQRKLEARQNQVSDETEGSNPEGQEPRSSEGGKRDAPEPRKPKERKQKARGTAKSAGEKPEPRAQRNPGDGTQGARDAEKRDNTKRQGQETRKPDDKQVAPPQKEAWQIQKEVLKEKFPEGWSPRKRLSPDALAGIRALHQQFPDEYTTEVLASKFEVSPEAIRRILKSKWQPRPEEEIERQDRWFNRGKRIWSAWAEEGKKPPTKWRREGITRDPSYHEQRRARSHAQRKLSKTLM